MDPFVQFIQQYAPLFGILTAIAAVPTLAFKIYKTAHDRQLADLFRRIKELERENEVLTENGSEGLRLLNQQLQEQLEKAKDDTLELETKHTDTEVTWHTEISNLQEEVDRLHQIVECRTQELQKNQEELGKKDQADRTRFNLLKRAMKLEGKVWERKVLQGAPHFRPLAERHSPIISILNLKGGVGKTTITAHLGAVLSAKGYRVLLVDLDLQGSLSSLFMSESALVQRSKERLLLQHYLLSVTERRKANLTDCCVPIMDGKSAIVPNADSMAYAELNLTMQWLLRLGKRDTRFLLRKSLQQKRMTNRYDIILLDCPPLFNTCCVNALAASDYILIPVLPSKKAAERVPLLLERLQSLHQVINPQLQVMGILLNRTHAASLTAWEQDLWGEMLEHAKDRWKLPVHAFNTFIRQTTEVREREIEFSPAAPGSELYTLFSQLAMEVEVRLPGDCRRTTATSIGHG